MVGPLFKASVVPGDGVVAREGAVVVVAHPSTVKHEEFVDTLLALLADGAGDPGHAPLDLVRRVAAAVTTTAAEDVPPFGLVTRHGEDLVTLLTGDIDLRLSRDGSDEVSSGLEASTFVERITRAPFDELLLSSARDAVPDPRSNLAGGVVRGAGVLLVPGDTRTPVGAEEPTRVDLAPGEEAGSEPAPAEPDPPVSSAVEPAAPAEPPAFTSISLFGDADPADSPGEGPGEETRPAAAAPQVQGIVCSRGHFNSPEARFCVRCGISMVHQTHHLVMGTRPPLGVLVADDGAVHPLSGDLVIGRDPETADDVRSGAATPLLLDDAGGSMSRVHARVLLVDWDVRVVDAASANGTYVAASEAGEWRRLEPGVPTTLQPGARISMGGRTVTFESHQTR